MKMFAKNVGTLAVIVFQLLIGSSWSNIAINKVSIQALEALYSATSGPNWQYISVEAALKWNFSDTSQICSWDGICCIDAAGKFDSSSACIQLVTEKHYNVSQLPVIIPVPSSVVALSLQHHKLNGTLPDKLFNLTTLQHLALDGNSLNGTIPLTISKTSLLSWLTLGDNHMTGILPSCLSTLNSLTIFSFAKNDLASQSLPSFLWSLTKLSFLDLSTNNFYGTLSKDITHLKNLNIIYFNHNSLAGPLPDLFGNDNLLDLDFHQNHFTGTFPAQMSGIKFEVLDLSRNFLTGTLPSSISLMSSLRDLYLFNNSMRGSIATELGLLPSLINVYLHNNFLVGTIPSEIMTSNLQILSLGNNSLGGTLSSNISNMVNLNSLSLNSNFFVGRLPNELSLLSRLNELFFQFNSFSGQINTQFSDKMLLETVQLSGNHFTGPFPVSLFRLKRLSNLIVVGACFSGSLPSQVCEARSLKVLALNGLTSSSHCQRSLLGNNYSPLYFMSGTIPSCIFALPRLTKLELSGNGFNGQLLLPNSHSTLQSLTLSYNRLSGTIPNNLQQTTSLILLDLSFNRLSGEISLMGNFFAPHVNETRASAHHSLKLDVNQLSGDLPNEFWDANCNLTVVNGNLLDCGSHAAFPHNDIGWLTNYCGAYNLNVALIFGATIIGLCGLIAVGLVYLSQWNSSRASDDSFTGSYGMSRRSTLIVIAKDTASLLDFVLECISKSNRVPLWAQKFDVLNSDNVLYEMPITVSFVQFAKTIQWLTLATCLITLFPIMLLQIMFKYVNHQQYSSHKNQYTFTPSLAYVKGYVPAGILFALVVVLGTRLHWIIKVKYDLYARFRQPSILGFHTPFARKKFMVILVMLIANIIIMGGANYLYLTYSLNYIPHWQASTNIGIVLEICLGLFKCIWNMFGLSFALRKVKRLVNLDHPASFMPTALLSSLMIINNIFIPMIFTMASDPNCFYFGFIAQLPSVEFRYKYYSDCEEQRGFNQPLECIQGTPFIDVVKFDPPFMYGYQCSSAVLNYYAPVFVAMFSFMIILSPFTCSVVPYLFSHVQDGWLRRFLRFIQSPITQSRMQSVQDLESSRLILASDMTAASLITSFTMLLTYGLAYPLLGVLIALAICVDVLQQRYSVGRYLTYCNEVLTTQQRSILRAKLEFACDGMANALDKFKWVIVMTVALYYSLYVLDMTGNNANVDWSKAQWLPILLLLWPLLLAGVNLIHIYGSNLVLGSEDTHSHSQPAALSSSSSSSYFSRCTLILGRLFVRSREVPANEAETARSLPSSTKDAVCVPGAATQVYYVQYNSKFDNDADVNVL